MADDMTGKDYRAKVIKELDMTDDEQDHCWILLNSAEVAALNRDSATAFQRTKELSTRVSWLRTDSGKRYMQGRKP